MPTPPVAAAMLYDLVQCPHRVTMDLRADPIDRDETNPFIQLLLERGAFHENEIIDGLGVPFLDLSPCAGDEKERLTREAMDRREPLIYGGRIQADDLLGVADATIRKEPEVLRAALRWADPRTPAVFDLPPASRPRERSLTRDEYDRLLAAAETPHLRLFVILALATAGRARAILDLTWDRVDFQRGLIRLADGTARRKGRATVPMTETARDALLEAHKAARTPWVIEYADRPVASIKKAFRRTALKAGLRDVSPHVLRHTAAVWMAEAGRPMAEIAQYLGHEDDRITQRVYARYSPDYLRQAVAALEKTNSFKTRI